MCHECIKGTHLLLGVAKSKESAPKVVSSMCHECIKKTRLFFGVAKNNEPAPHRMRGVCHIMNA